MQTRPTISQNEVRRMTTDELRETFLLADLFAKGALQLTHWETDRAVIGSAVPLHRELSLETSPELAAGFFCERRELGVLNLGGAGTVLVDGMPRKLASLDALYVGRGSREVAFSTDDAATPARFFLMSYPAHTTYPTTVIRKAGAREIRLGSRETANERVIRQYIHEEGAKSCQLVMGFTELATGSVWNTMPPHTHLRRSEVYLYFNVPVEAAVFHFMGSPQETRHLLVHSEQAVLSPPWSIHSGCGTQAYSFVWAMGGENQRFADMDAAPVKDLL